MTEMRGGVHGVMAALAWLPRLLALHLVWLVLTLAGGVIGGIAPATATLVALLHGDEELTGDAGVGPRVRAVLRRYREEFVPANRAGSPFVLIVLAAAADLALGVAGALPAWFFPLGFALAGLFAAIGALALFHAISLHVLRPDAPAPELWRGALGGIVLLPLASASWTITLVAAVLVSGIIQPVGLLLGGGILVAVTTFVLVRSWQSRLDAATA